MAADVQLAKSNEQYHPGGTTEHKQNFELFYGLDFNSIGPRRNYQCGIYEWISGFEELQQSPERILQYYQLSDQVSGL